MPFVNAIALHPRQIIVASIVTLALLVFGLSAQLAWDSYSRYRTLNQMDRVNTMVDDLTTFASVGAVERGLTMMALGSARPANAELRDKITQARRVATARYQHALAEANVLHSQLPNDQAIQRAIGTMQQAWTALEMMRSGIDACLAGHRCTVNQTEWLTTVTRAITVSASLRDAALLPLDIPWRIAQLNTTLNRWVWVAAERTGRERAVFAFHISAGKPVPTNSLHELELARAVVQRSLADIRGQGNTPGTNANIVRAIDDMNARLHVFERLRSQAYAGSKTGQYQLNGTQWFYGASEAIDAILAVGTAGSRVTAALIADELQQARLRLGAHLAMLGITILLAVASLTRIRRMTKAVFSHAEEVEREVASKTRDLSRSDERTQTIIANAPDAVLSMDAKGRITGWNPSCEKIFGWSPEEVLGRDLGDTIIPVRYREAHREGFQNFLRHGKHKIIGHVIEATALHRNGGEFPIELAIGTNAQLREGDYIFTAFIRDITARKQAEDKLANLANYDTLTGLPNRTLFMDRLDQALRVQQRHGGYIFALLFLDLDGFKNVNDTLGHAVGDKLLQRVSTTIKDILRKSDTAARLGGDEFTIILDRIGQPTDVGRVAQKLIDAISEQITIDGHEIFISTSIGITLCPEDGADATDLLRNADTAMYQAKDQGKGRFVSFTQQMNERISKRVSLENRLRNALDRDEFCLYYQPQVALDSGRIVGVEALIRWMPADSEPISPLDFIPIAEESGLIIPIGQWVLQTACAQAQAWTRAGLPPIHVAVNLSGRQFKQTDLAREVDDALRDTGLSAAQLELEITESMAMEGAEKSLVILSQLKEMGISVAVDDFGTGYSSLSYLRRFPIDTLKIDRSFIKDMTEDNNAASIARSIIAMGHSLNLKVVAEGVETAAQGARLQEFGCNNVQGYYFFRPLPSSEITALLGQGGIVEK